MSLTQHLTHCSLVIECTKLHLSYLNMVAEPPQAAHNTRVFRVIFYMLWKCRMLVCYWRALLNMINQVYQMQLEHALVVCLLGGINEEQFLPEVRIPVL